MIPQETERSSGNVRGDVQEAMESLPVGKTGLVLGSGGKTDSWRKRGWWTLDIVGKHRADFVGDARFAAERYSDLDYLVAEGLVIKDRPKWYQIEKSISEGLNFFFPAATGISAVELANVAHACLRPGGVFVFLGGEVRGYPSGPAAITETLRLKGFEIEVQYKDWVLLDGDGRRVTVFAGKR